MYTGYAFCVVPFGANSNERFVCIYLHGSLCMCAIWSVKMMVVDTINARTNFNGFHIIYSVPS